MFLSTRNELLYLPLVEQKSLISSQALHFVMSVTSFSPAPEDLLQCSGQLVKSQQWRVMFEMWHEYRKRGSIIFGKYIFLLWQLPFILHSDNLIWDCIVELSSNVSHSNYTLVKTWDGLWTSDKWALFSVVSRMWGICDFWFSKRYNYFVWPFVRIY